MRERWVSLEHDGFSQYFISNYGRVRNKDTHKILQVSNNQQGITKITLTSDDEGERYTVSVALLVARHFVPGANDIFNTPIHLNGDRSNNHAGNLMWRPRWFAVQYHQQFNKPPHRFRVPVRCLDDGALYPNAREAARTYGLLEMDIINDLTNQLGVFPGGYKFDLYHD